MTAASCASAARTPHLGRVAMLSVHTSPLEQPGTGDAGGMNVYVVELARRLAARGIEVEIFTRATAGVAADRRRAVSAGSASATSPPGPFEGLTKSDLPGPAVRVRARRAAHRGLRTSPATTTWSTRTTGSSGQVGALARDRWGVPLVHSMHTMAKVKNAALADGDDARAGGPADRRGAGGRRRRPADRQHRGRGPAARRPLRRRPRIACEIINPGVDLSDLPPGRQSRGPGPARPRPRRAGRDRFVGRIQPLKAPDVVLRAAARSLLERAPSCARRLVVAVVGGPSGSGLGTPDSLRRAGRASSASTTWCGSCRRSAQDELVDYYRAPSSLVCVPSYNESFGLVALEAQACGTPVVAADVGGLPTAVRDGVTGLLVDGHRSDDYADVIERLLDRPATAGSFGRACCRARPSFGWERTAERHARGLRRRAGEDAPRDLAAAE